MYIVTGGAGFIGSNIVKGLNDMGTTDILVVDNMQNSAKFQNISDLQLADYMGKDDFAKALKNNEISGNIEAIFHQGACSDTMEYDGSYMMSNNYEYSKRLFHFAESRKIPFVYASSASVYGANTTFKEEPAFELPLNIYGYSKLLFDRYVQRFMPTITSTVVGLRYFNVYGPREQHKGRMASMVHQIYHQLLESSKTSLFQGSGGYGDGEQRRDFVSVHDVVSVNLHFARESASKGIFNVGTGKCRSFNDIANIFISRLGQGTVEYRPIPASLRDKYQSFTEADITNLRQAGYAKEMTTLEDGIAAFLTES